jgi:hypothetical protein
VLVVNLCGGDVPVAKQLLHFADAHARVTQIRIRSISSSDRSSRERSQGFVVRGDSCRAICSGLFEQAAFVKAALQLQRATTASILLPALFPFAQSLSGKARLPWRKEQPPAQKASFLSGNTLAAEDEGRALSLNGQALCPKASFFPD